MRKIDNPAAFPTSIYNPGMTLRDWFAGQALTGILASGSYSNSGAGFHQFISEWSFVVADCMLTERAKASNKVE